MTAQTPMTAAEVFDGYDFRTNGGRWGSRFFFNGHLTAKELVEKYRLTHPESEWTYTLDTTTARHAWQVFTPHEDTCYLVTDADPDDPFTADDYDLCTCETYQCLEHEGSGYEYRHPHPATAGTPGAIPVTWVDAA